MLGKLNSKIGIGETGPGLAKANTLSIETCGASGGL